MYIYYIKEKQTISSKSNEAANKALLKEVAKKLSSVPVLLKEKHERAKAYLKTVQFPSEKKAGD